MSRIESYEPELLYWMQQWEKILTKRSHAELQPCVTVSSILWNSVTQTSGLFFLLLYLLRTCLNVCLLSFSRQFCQSNRLFRFRCHRLGWDADAELRLMDSRSLFHLSKSRSLRWINSPNKMSLQGDRLLKCWIPRWGNTVQLFFFVFFPLLSA